MKHVFSILFVYLLTVCQVMYAQIERLTVDDGLSQNFIFKIFQDSRGFIWIGTKDGLNRYDGNNFVVYRHDPFDSTSLSDNEVTEIIEDRNGVLWIGTNDGGLNCFDRATERFTRYTAIINDSLSLNQFIIARICEGKNHVLWVATNTGLIKFDKSKGVSEFFPPQQDDSLHLRRQGIYNVYENRDGVLWLTSTESGLVRMDVWNQPIRQHRSIYQASGQEQIIKTFKYHEQTRALYLLTSSNVVVMNATTNLFRTLINDEHDTTNFIGGSLEEVGPNLYIGVRYNLFEFDIYNKVKKNIINIPEGYFTSLFRDISGTLWLGTNGSGVYKYVPRANRFHHSEGSFLRTLFERELAACRRLDINLEPALSGRAAWFPAMLKDSKGNFWVVSSGVTKLDASMSKVKKFPSPMLPDSIMSNGVMDILLEDNAGTVWLGAPKGIGYFDRTDKFQYVRLYPAVNQFNVTGIQNFDYKDITCIYQDKKGTFWLGTPVLGLIRFEPSTNNIRYFQQQRSNPKSISNNHVLTICEDPNGDDNVLWIGTDGGGLNRFDKLSGELTHFTEKNGLPNNVVYGVLSDTMGNLWMSTNKGLCKYSTRGAVSADGQGSAFGGNPSSGSIRTYDVSDGLQSNEFNRKEYFKTKSGEIFFGGVNGYNHFYPEEISDNPIPPKIEFTDFKLSNRSVSYHDANSPLKQSIGETKSIVLDYSQNMFTLEFSALDFSTSQKNQYAYMLNGFDEHWNYAGTLRSATYTNIAPGEYTFRVKASNSDGVWNEQGASMEIIILPPFWMTWWFRGIGILLFLTAGPTISFRRVKQLQREQQQQEEFSRKLIERQELERKRIASELHDGVGQDLLVVKNKLLLAIDTVEQGTMDVQQLNDAAQFASQAIEEVRSISHNLRPSNLDQLGLTMAIETAVESVATSSTIRFSLNIENIDGLVTPENEINVYRIVQESLNNVVKHSQATEAGVEVRRELDSVLINVQDNGRGFRMNVEGLNTPKERFGLSGMKERAKALSGSLTIQQRESGGTIVQLSVPIQLTTKND